MWTSLLATRGLLIQSRSPTALVILVDLSQLRASALWPLLDAATPKNPSGHRSRCFITF